MANTIIIINQEQGLQARWTSIYVNDLSKTITTTYNIEQVTPDGIAVIETKSYSVTGAGFDGWDAQLGAVIRGAIVNGIKNAEGIPTE